MIEVTPSFGYRTVAFLMGFNGNIVQRIFRARNWQVRKRPIGMRSHIQALPSVATAPNERWSRRPLSDPGRRWTSLAEVIDGHTRELLGGHPAGRPPLEHALINRFGRVSSELLVRSFSRRHYKALVVATGSSRGSSPCPGSNRWRLRRLDPQQNGLVERVIRTLKEQCVHCHRFERIQHDARAIRTESSSTSPAVRIGQSQCGHLPRLSE